MNLAATEGSTRTENFEIDHPEEYGRFFLRDKREILFHLNLLTKRGNLVTAYLDGGPVFFLTSILLINDELDELILDAAQEDTLNQLATLAREITLITSHEKVKIQIRVEGAKKIERQGHAALVVSFPSKMLRLQRREFFRLEPPLSSPLFCEFTVTNRQGALRHLNLNIADISGGGVSLVAATTDADYFERDTLLKDCRLDISEEGALLANLRIRKVIEVSTHSGHHNLRLGCEFINLKPNYLSMIQRYITRIERERKANFA